ncbi:MAG: nitroreductase [Hyphomicrobiaceae bacterium]|jgi:nitroreductase
MPKPDQSADLFEIMYSCRAMRRFKPDPIPEAVIEQLIDAAIQCPSGSNAQNWKFVVVRDRDKLTEIQKLWKTSWAFYGETVNAVLRPGEDPAAKARQSKAGTYMVDHMHEVPALIFVCAKRDDVLAEAFASPSTLMAAIRHFGLGGALNLITSGSKTSIQAAGGAAFPAVQNLLLAARALGLGAVLTTPHLFQPGAYEKIVGIPAEATLCAVIPVGYPLGKFGPIRRPPAQDAMSWDTY